MSVDKFGRYKSAPRRTQYRQPQNGCAIKLDADGNYDINTRRLTNIGEPESDTDACSKIYTESIVKLMKDNLEAYVSEGIASLSTVLVAHIGYAQKVLELINTSVYGAKGIIIDLTVAEREAMMKHRMVKRSAEKSVINKDV